MNEQLTPVALTIAGSDSSGGAGIQADLKTFHFFNVFGTSALTAITAQNPGRLESIYPLSGQAVSEQIETVTEKIVIKAAKTGMLFNTEIIEAVTEQAQHWQDNIKLVIDPVMAAASGARLLQEDAIKAFRCELLPLATVITPNIPEAEILADSSISDKSDVIEAARLIADKFACAVVIKGGHRATDPMLDLLVLEDNIYWLSSPLLSPPNSHGSGCSMSAAIAACLARGMDIVESVVNSKAYVYETLKACCRLGQDTWCPGLAQELPADNISITEVS